MARRTEGRLLRLEQSVNATARQGWAAVDLAAIADRVCAEFGITGEQLERELERSSEETSGYPNAIVETYHTAFSAAMRSAGLTFVDLVQLADLEGAL